MRVIHVVPGLSEEASGPSYSVLRLCEALQQSGARVTLATLEWSPIPNAPSFVRPFPIGVGPKRLGRSPRMAHWLDAQATAGEVDIIHNHGMWQMNALYPAWAASSNPRTRLVTSPRGAFSDWAMGHGSVSKRVFWPVLQRPALRKTACFHATAEAESEDVRRRGFTQPIAIIPNGIDLPDLAPKLAQAPRTLLFLGRIHPVKGVDVLLHAWSSVMDDFPRWRLVIIGGDRGYVSRGTYLAEMTALAATLRLQRIEFLPPRYGADKWDAYRQAELYVLPTHSENFGITVAEALAAGTPVIVSKGAPWAGLRREQCGWWIDYGVDALVAALRLGMSRSEDELAAAGSNGRAWMAREFSWPIIAQRTLGMYEWILFGGTRPPWIRDDLSRRSTR